MCLTEYVCVCVREKERNCECGCKQCFCACVYVCVRECVRCGSGVGVCQREGE